MSTKIRILILVLILCLAFFLRFYNLGNIPAGLHADAASQGYNAFSLLQTGKDRYGQSLPILFRAYGYYQPPLYTYLTVIPVAIFGNSQFSAHFISALSGFILVAITYLFVLELFKKNQARFVLALIAALVLAMTPWSVFFSRLAVEANLGLLLFVTSLLLFIYSLKKTYILPIASLILGISTHAYYSERLIAVIFLPVFLFLFRKNFLPRKRLIILALLFFAVTQIPHLMMLKSGAFTQRFTQVSNLDNDLSGQSRILNIIQTTLGNYLIYYSPYNLFFDSDTKLGRTMPGLSVFYNWFILPFIIGIWYLLKHKSNELAKIIWLLLIITPLSASFTGDFFYPLRALELFWILTLVISIGFWQIYILISSNIIKLFLFGTFIAYFLFSLYISYFILFKYEKAGNYGYPYLKLMDKLSEYRDKKIIIDLSRDPGVGVRLAYLKNYPPLKMQDQLQPQLKTPYYSNVINTDEIYSIDNLEIKPLDFGDACKDNVIMVGDIISISPKQAEEHNLKLAFEIYNLSGKVALKGYSAHPEQKCYKYF